MNMGIMCMQMRQFAFHFPEAAASMSEFAPHVICGNCLQDAVNAEHAHATATQNANKLMVIGGSVPQRMPSCLDVLDKVLNLDLPVYSSIVPADTKRSLGDGSEDLLKVVCHVLGVKDADSLSDDTTLGDLGMDSLMAVEIRQGLERDYDVIMSATEVRQLRVGQIREMSDF